jgi:hypothetical protein
MGDLAEEFAAGASRRWFWREALAATARSIRNAVRQHPIVLLRAIAAYGVLFVLFAYVVGALVRHTPVLMHAVSLSSYLRLTVLDILGLVATLPVCALAAWTVARFHPSVQVPAALAIIAWWLIRDVELRRLLANIDDLRFLPYLIVHFAVLLEFVSGLLIGGMFLPARKDG